MADKAETTSSENSESSSESAILPKKGAPSRTMKIGPKTAPSTAGMVNEAIERLKERGGSSLPAIKKYIANAYDLDMERRAIFIKKYLRAAVANGSLVQTKGRGASGSFKFPSAKEKSALAKAAAEEKASAAKKLTSAKKIDSGKVSSTTTKQTSKKVMKKLSTSNQKTKTVGKLAEPKSPSKTKRSARSPTSKPRAPKPKKVSAVLKSPKVANRKMTAAKK